ncbi:kinesin-like nuclear fusion protein [Diatrype stigma]|uniref:Kinesin-like nuclear fusion protein n=1 Tax=Diatrype stigma TaxID=117547 RepID=A0AAN9U5W5_9PEZI
MQSAERNHLVKRNNLEQDHRKAIHKFRDQQRALEYRLEVTRKDHDHASKEAELQQRNEITNIERRYEKLIHENATALEKKNELAQQLQGQLDTLAGKLQREHETEMRNREKDIQKLQEDVNGHLFEKAHLLEQHRDQVEALKATENLLKRIDAQQASKDDLKKAHEEQNKLLQAIEKGIQEMDASQPNKDNVTQQYEEQAKSLQTIKKQLEDMDGRQLDKAIAMEKYDEQVKSLTAIEAQLQKMDERQRNQEGDSTRHEEQLNSLQAIEKHLVEIDARQLDKDNATAVYQEQMNALNGIGKRLEDMSARQVEVGNVTARYEEQVESLNAVRRRIEEMDERQLDANLIVKYEAQITSLNAIGKRLEDIDARQLDKDNATQKHDEEVQILRGIESLLKDMNNPDIATRKQEEQAESFRAIETLIKKLDEHQPDKDLLEANHREQVQELKMIGDLVKALSAQQPQEKLAQTHQEQMEALNSIGNLVNNISTQNFAQRHEEQVKTLIVIEDLLKEVTAQHPDRREIIEKHEEQLRNIKSLESEFKVQLENVENAINTFGSEQHGKEYLERKHQEILQALERTRPEEPDASLKTQLTGIQQLLRKIDTQQQTAQQMITEQPPIQVLDESHLPKTGPIEDTELLRKMKEENEDMQQRFQGLADRLEEANRALASARLEMQQTGLDKEALERSAASWRQEKGDLESQLATVTNAAANAKTVGDNLESEIDRLQRELDTERKHLELETKRLQAHIGELAKKSEAQEYGRRHLFEQVQTLRGNIRVMCRIRPPLPETPQKLLVDFHPARGEFVDHYQKIEVIAERATATGQVRQSSKFLECERIFTAEHTNKDVFEEISQLTASAMQGKKVTIFCYGQTGSGKTFTMNHRVDAEGGSASDDDGIIHRSLRMVFADASATRARYRYDMQMSIVEVYINDLIDLLHARKKHTIKSMDEATEKEMTSYEAVDGLIEQALNNRVVGATNANASSSRSHLILCFKLQRTVLAEGPEQGRVDRGILNLIDLAGSEKNKETGATGQRLEESKAINGSIFELNQSITALAEGRPKRPGHTLTRVLDPCLGRGCRVVMFVMVSPLKKDQAETENTMAKAETAAKAKLNSKITLSPTSPLNARARRSSIPVLKKDPTGTRKGPAINPKGK